MTLLFRTEPGLAPFTAQPPRRDGAAQHSTGTEAALPVPFSAVAACAARALSGRQKQRGRTSRTENAPAPGGPAAGERQVCAAPAMVAD